ncbi:hypothetical protein EXS54_00715 [Patescibacteria group bacterium]|nr:hypothetical protein [Patescibacteria group bacterium]
MVEDPGYPTGDVFDQYHVEAEITFLQTFLERGSWYPDGWEHVTHVPLGLRDPDFSLEFQNLLGLSGEEAEQWSERAREVLEKTWFNGVLYLDDEEKEFLKSVEDFLVRAQEEANRFTVPSI